MARIKLEPTVRKTLEVERPDGKIILLEIKPLLVSEVESNEIKSRQNQDAFAKREITSIEFLFRTIEMTVRNFDRNDFIGFEYEHLELVLEELRKLKEKEISEKKNINTIN